MIKHIVFFKLNDNSEKNKKLVKDKLLTLKDNIKVLKHIEVGINFAKEDRAYDLALITEFESKEDLDAYALDQFHQNVIKFIKTVANDTKVVDFVS
jgi:hypothetical protein